MSRPKKTPRSTSSTGGSVEARIGAEACARSGPAQSEVRTTTIPRRERFMWASFPCLLEHERVGHHGHAAALWLGEDPGQHAASDALVELRRVGGGVHHVRGGDRAALGDDPPDRDLAGELRVL